MWLSRRKLHQVTGFKICAERRSGEDCDECVENHFGETCLTYCKGKEEYMCSEIGEIVCNDESTTPDNNCKKNNIPIIAGVGAGVAVFLVVTLLSVYRYYKKDVNDEEDTT